MGNTPRPVLGFSPLTPEQLVEQLRAHGGQPCGFSLPRGTSTANSSERVAQIGFDLRAPN